MQISCHFISGTWACTDFGIWGEVLEPVPWRTVLTSKGCWRIKERSLPHWHPWGEAGQGCLNFLFSFLVSWSVLRESVTRWLIKKSLTSICYGMPGTSQVRVPSWSPSARRETLCRNLCRGGTGVEDTFGRTWGRGEGLLHSSQADGEWGTVGRNQHLRQIWEMRDTLVGWRGLKAWAQGLIVAQEFEPASWAGAVFEASYVGRWHKAIENAWELSPWYFFNGALGEASNFLLTLFIVSSLAWRFFCWCKKPRKNVIG